MAITDAQRVDFLWKKVIFGATETDITGKSGANESIPSPLFVLPSQLWANAADIPVPAPATSTTIVEVRKETSAVECLPDSSVAGDKTWIAVADVGQSEAISGNRLGDWIPPALDTSYVANVWAGDPNTDGVKLNPLVNSQEWIFDYTAGVLHFPNSVPSSLSGSRVFLEGYRYIGPKGISGGTGDGGSAVQELTFTHTTNSLGPESREDFELATGSVAMIVQLSVNVPCTVECHTTSARNDSNPYQFVAIASHLADDGSYVIGAERFYGPRFAHVYNLENFNSDLTFWRILNNSSSNITAQVVLRVAKLG